MELTRDEQYVAAVAFALKLEGKAFAPEPLYLPDCERLKDEGILSRRMENGDAIYEMTDEGEAAMRLLGLMVAPCLN